MARPRLQDDSPITVSADWTLPGSEEIRVTVTLQPGWFRRPLQDSFIVRPEVAPPREDGHGERRLTVCALPTTR